MKKLVKVILCHNCGFSLERDDLFRSCGNCFACLGCEIYICPECGIELVVRPRRNVEPRGVDDTG